ncbi:MAG: hypothetical protein A4S09_02435 [Proteobacteria bacterium SG_bin7]|nr:MAG: hypothetical protein A4S09_02435 [Proteobacteria bacterium SG_bin7]
MKIALAVVIPNFNHAHYLSDSLNSLMNQTRPPDRIIVVDDASTDNSIAVLEESRKRYGCIDIIRNEKNFGVVASTMRGLEAVTEEFVFMMAADDILMPTFFEESLALLMQNPQANLCVAHSAFLIGKNIDSNNRIKKPCENSQYLSPDRVLKALQEKKLWIPGHTAVYRTHAFRNEGAYIPELKWYSDWFLVYSMALRKGLCYIPEPLAAFRLLHESYSAKGRRDHKIVAEIIWNILNLLNSPKYLDVKEKFLASTLLHRWKEFQHEIKDNPNPWQSWKPRIKLFGAGGKINLATKKFLYSVGGEELLGFARLQYQRLANFVATR